MTIAQPDVVCELKQLLIATSLVALRSQSRFQARQILRRIPKLKATHSSKDNTKKEKKVGPHPSPTLPVPGKQKVDLCQEMAPQCHQPTLTSQSGAWACGATRLFLRLIAWWRASPIIKSRTSKYYGCLGFLSATKI